MSRTPRPHYRNSPSGDQPGQLTKLDYIKAEYKDFLSLARVLASEEMGVQIPNEKGNLAETLLEISALLAHILASYQDLYASEAFLSTAISPKNLIRHARRLAYEPDAGLSATGFEALTIKDDLTGRIPKGFAFASTPLGEQKAQTFETLADLDVDAQWNAMLPVNAQKPTRINFNATLAKVVCDIPLVGIGHDLAIGGRVVLTGAGNTVAMRICEVEESVKDNETIVKLTTVGSTAFPLMSLAAVPYQFDFASRVLTGHHTGSISFFHLPTSSGGMTDMNMTGVMNITGVDALLEVNINSDGTMTSGQMTITGSIVGLGIPAGTILLTGQVENMQLMAENASHFDFLFTIKLQTRHPELQYLAGYAHWFAYISNGGVLDSASIFTMDWGPWAVPLDSYIYVGYNLAPGDYQLLADPASSLNVFGWNKDNDTFDLASPSTFSTLQPLNGTETKGDAAYGYVVNGSSVSLGKELFLSSIVTDPLQGQLIVIDNNHQLSAYAVTAENSVNVSYHHEVVDSVDVKEVTVASGQCSINTVTHKFVVASAITDTGTAVTLQSPHATATKIWAAFPTHARVFAHWRKALTVSAKRPNPATVDTQVTLAASLKGMRPGRHLILSNLDESKMSAVNLARYDSHNDNSGTIYWQATGDSWTLGDFKVLGNIARISHGETVTEILGDSDGVSSFQRYTLKKLPVTQTPGADGGELNLEVRVNDVAWAEVNDFHDAKAEDRVYMIERDEDQAITVIFGGGGQGAVPPAGKKNVTASYRIGLGRDGNVDAGRVSRVKKASPILDRAINTQATGGGAAPADPEDIRSQATRYIRTFERAVSVSDYADLALLFPGVARASAQWHDDTGVQLTAATAEGIELEARDVLRVYLDHHRDVTVPLTFVPPEPVPISVTAELFSNPAYLTENVKLAAQDKLYLDDPEQPPGRFTFAAQQLGQAAFLSQLYDILSDVDGVVRVRITTFDIKPEVELRDVIRVTASQWLRLDPEDCDISVVTASDDEIASGGAL